MKKVQMLPIKKKLINHDRLTSQSVADKNYRGKKKIL